MKGETVNISGAIPYPEDQYRKHYQNPTYPRKGKECEGDFQSVLDAEMKKMEPTHRPRE